MVEEWRATHHPDYDVSNMGQIRSRAANRRRNIYKILKCSKTNGYPSVGFWPDTTRYLVHVLVMIAFVGPRPPGLHVLHGDDNPGNARLDNLSYGTPLQNVRDCIARGRQTRRRFTDEQVRAIRQTLNALPKTGPAGRIPDNSAKRLAQQFGVSERCIESIRWMRNYKNA